MHCKFRGSINRTILVKIGNAYQANLFGTITFVNEDHKNVAYFIPLSLMFVTKYQMYVS